MKNKNFTNFAQLLLKKNRRTHYNFLLLFQLLFILLPGAMLCQNLDDFRTAANSDGPNLIPFYDLRRDATAIANEVQNRKSEVASTRYDDWKPQKENFLIAIKKQKDLIKKNNEFMEQYKVINPDGSIGDCIKSDNSKQERIISENNEKVTKINEKLKAGVDSFERLSNARGGLREYFDDAIKLLNQAKSYPNKYIGELPSLGDNPSDDDKKKLEKYNEDKKKLEEYATTSIDKIQSQVRTHQDQETGSIAMKRAFEELLKLSE